MATRNRTTAFLKYRDTIKQTRPSTSRLSAGSAGSSSVEHSVIEMELQQRPVVQNKGYMKLSTSESSNLNPASSSSLSSPSSSSPLPPLWVEISETVKEDMKKIKLKLSELNKAQHQALLPTFDSASSDENEDRREGGRGTSGKKKRGKMSSSERSIEILTMEITRELKKCEKNLQRLPSSAGAGEGDSASASGVAIIAKNMQRSLATDLQTLSMEFRKISKAYLKRLQQQQEDDSLPSSSSTSSSSSSFASSLSSSFRGAFSSAASVPQESEDDQDLDTGFDERQMLRSKGMENLSVEREKEIHEVVESVNELAQVMRDLSVLVIDQGTIVDRIDYNIKNVQEKVEKGVKHLKKAEASQKKSALIFCIMVLMAICVALFLLLILKLVLF